MTAATARRTPKVPLVQLNFEEAPEGRVAAYMPVRWCVDPARLLTELQERRYTKPHLLICIQHTRTANTIDDFTTIASQDTAYYVLPLQQELAYIAFQRPGINRVLAVIVDVADSDTAAKLWKLRRQGKPSSYHDSLFDEKGKPIEEAFLYNDIPSYIETGVFQEVDVDPEMFAPEPAPWRKRVVNTFFESKPHDQCHFRKRFWFISMPLLLVLVPIATVLKFGAAIGAGVFLGLYDVNYKSVFNPLKLSPKEPVRHAGPSRYYIKRTKRPDGYLEESRQFPVWWVVNPMVLLVPGFLVFLFYGYGQDWGLLGTLVRVNLWIIGGSIIVALVVAIVSMVGNYISNVRGSESYQQKRARRKEEEARRRKEAMEAAIKAMSCTIGDKTASVDALPPEKRTIKLRFAEVKGAVCKPFAR